MVVRRGHVNVGGLKCNIVPGVQHRHRSLAPQHVGEQPPAAGTGVQDDQHCRIQVGGQRGNQKRQRLHTSGGSANDDNLFRPAGHVRPLLTACFERYRLPTIPSRT